MSRAPLISVCFSTLPQLALNDVMNIFDCAHPGHEYFIHLDCTQKLTYLRNYNGMCYVNEINLSKEETVLGMHNTHHLPR